MNDAQSTGPEPNPSVSDGRRLHQSETTDEVGGSGSPAQPPQGQPATAEVPAALADHPRYRVLKALGRGGMGAVYLAEHKVMKRMVALKVIRPDLAAHPEVVHRFRREVEAVAHLTHPNIVAAHDAEQAGDCFFLVMEYVDGVDLARRLKEHGRLPVAEACDAVRQASLGLQYAHERGLVHRDLKPHNLMQTPSGVVKVLDFGLARVSQLTPEGGTVSGVVLGTPNYMAPEQANDPHQADIRSDIYSLGCTLYELLGGRVPFPGGGLVDKLRKQALEPPTPLRQLRPELGAGLVRVIDRMMAKDAAERLQTPAEVVAALEPWCAPLPETVGPDKLVRGGGGAGRGRRAVVVGAAVFGTCALGLLAWLAVHLPSGSTASPTEATGQVTAKVAPAPPALVVCADGTGDFSSLRQAVRDAPAGSHLLVRPGHYQEAIDVRKQLEIAGGPGGGVVLESSDGTPLTLSADGVRLRRLTVLTKAKKPAVDILAGSGVLLDECDISSTSWNGLTVTNSETEVVVRKCSLHDCKETGCHVSGGAKVTFEDSRFAGNGNNGAELFGGGRGVFRRCQMNDNTHGVFAQVDAQTKLEECTLTANLSGLVVCNGARADLRHCKLHSNRAAGIHLYNKSWAVLDDCDIWNNSKEGIASYDAETIAVNCRINRNTIGLLSIRSKGRVEDCDLTGNGQWSIRTDQDSTLERKNNKE